MQSKVFDPKVHVSKPENEALERKEGNLCDEVFEGRSHRKLRSAQSKTCWRGESSKGADEKPRRALPDDKDTREAKKTVLMAPYHHSG